MPYKSWWNANEAKNYPRHKISHPNVNPYASCNLAVTHFHWKSVLPLSNTYFSITLQHIMHLKTETSVSHEYFLASSSLYSPYSHTRQSDFVMILNKIHQILFSKPLMTFLIVALVVRFLTACTTLYKEKNVLLWIISLAQNQTSLVRSGS